MSKIRSLKMARIKSHISAAELWGQLAEEAAELAQAALKMQRLCSGTNPPRQHRHICVAAVTEEHADLDLCFEMLGWDDGLKRKAIVDQKIDRWHDFLFGVEDAEEDSDGEASEG